MKRSLSRVYARVLATMALTAFVASCSDDPTSARRSLDAPPHPAIVDASGGGQPEFFWLPPAVQATPSYSGTFDSGALAELAVEVCELDVTASCTGSPIERVTSTTLPASQRLTINAASEWYEGAWLTGKSHAEAGRDYRVSVLRGTSVLGSVDVRMVRNTPALAAVDPARFTGLVAGQQFRFRFRLELPIARNYVRVNEVESNNGTPGDWVELYNANAKPFDLTGYVFKDNDDAHVYTLPAGTVIAGNGFLVIDESQFGFGLGAADQARLFEPGATTLVDSYAWTAHASTTYGRCPDGAGAFSTTSIVTKGAPNDCLPLVRINEVESNGGSPADWVELYNPTAAPISLAGYVLKDSNDANAFTLPAGLSIPANGYLVLEQPQFGFELDASDAVRLYRPGGLLLVDSFAWSGEPAFTYGRCPDGAGAFIPNAAVTKGSANDCTPPSTDVKINEVESNGGSPGDWVELYNKGATPVDLSGYVFKDNDDTHVYTIPSGTTIAAGGYLVLDELVNGIGNFTFGLGAPDAARLFAPDGTTIVDSYAWTAHAATTYGRCPTGSGAFTTSGAPTKGAPNNCGTLALAVKINEVESSGGTPGDWVELYNTGPTVADLSGYIFRDNGTTNYVIPNGTTIAAGGYLVLEEAQFIFGLGSADEARLFAPDGTTLIDSYAWTAHAATTYGRCPNGTGAFITTVSSTKGAANDCGATATFSPWAGSQSVFDADVGGSFFGGNMSGLVYEGSGSSTPGVLWAVRNGPGALFRLVWNGSIWITDTNGWASGKLLHYPNGIGDVDAEGVTRVGTAIYVSAERNNSNNGVSRNSILLFDPSSANAELTAVREWDLTSDLPPNGANLGLEAITYIPDAFLVANGFRDEVTNALYNPASYPDHNGGLFFVGVEATGNIYAYALNHVGGTFTRVATISSGFPAVMDLSFDPELQQLWAVCDNTCQGRSTILDIDVTPGSPTLGKFVITQRFERPTGMPDLNNEGFTMARQSECLGGFKPVFWSDDSQTNGVSIRRGLVSCSAF